MKKSLLFSMSLCLMTISAFSQTESLVSYETQDQNRVAALDGNPTARTTPRVLVVEDMDTKRIYAAEYDATLSVGQEVEYVVVEKERGITINTSHVEWEEIIIIKTANASEAGIENSSDATRTGSMAYKSGKGVIVGTQGTAF